MGMIESILCMYGREGTVKRVRVTQFDNTCITLFL